MNNIIALLFLCCSTTLFGQTTNSTEQPVPDGSLLKDSAVQQPLKSVVEAAPATAKSRKVYQDSLFSLKGDTILGQIIFSKSKNKFYFSNDTAKSETISATDFQSFVMSATDSTDRNEYLNIFGKFHQVEFGKGETITCYAELSYKEKREKGEKSYISQKRYCLFKEGSPYFLTKNNTKAILLDLTKECPKVVAKLTNEKDSAENVAAIIKEYNACFVKSE